jgi:hypothetical protein
MRWVAMSWVAAAACSFPGTGGSSDGPIGDPADAPFGTADAPRSDARAIDAQADARRIPDASPPDAGFSVDQCPVAYDLSFGQVPGSRFRYIQTSAPFATHHADCNDDRPGWTHLVAMNTVEEAQAIGALNMPSYSYVGAAQAPNQTLTHTGWRLFIGGVAGTGWSPVGTQPDDSDGAEDADETLAVVASTGNMHDVSGQTSYRAVCECDGLPIDPVVATYIP